ncbi:hypothetical protein FO519_000265 [Halicephalobus sp. NKZ332]|nr:hypothetical protein FO519_000265 [Halicephalobus sp. NKZ332]
MKKRRVEKRNSEDYDELQFEEQKDVEIVPWKVIGFALILSFVGIIIILNSYNSYSSNTMDYNTFLPIFVVGWLAVIPGVYHLWVAYQAYNKVPGYSFDDIPNFD